DDLILGEALVGELPEPNGIEPHPTARIDVDPSAADRLDIGPTRVRVCLDDDQDAALLLSRRHQAVHAGKGTSSAGASTRSSEAAADPSCDSWAIRASVPMLRPPGLDL